MKLQKIFLFLIVLFLGFVHFSISYGDSYLVNDECKSKLTTTKYPSLSVATLKVIGNIGNNTYKKYATKGLDYQIERIEILLNLLDNIYQGGKEQFSLTQQDIILALIELFECKLDKLKIAQSLEDIDNSTGSTVQVEATDGNLELSGCDTVINTGKYNICSRDSKLNPQYTNNFDGKEVALYDFKHAQYGCPVGFHAPTLEEFLDLLSNYSFETYGLNGDVYNKDERLDSKDILPILRLLINFNLFNENYVRFTDTDLEKTVQRKTGKIKIYPNRFFKFDFTQIYKVSTQNPFNNLNSQLFYASSTTPSWLDNSTDSIAYRAYNLRCFSDNINYQKETYNINFGEWGECINTYKERTVSCVNSLGIEVDELLCHDKINYYLNKQNPHHNKINLNKYPLIEKTSCTGGKIVEGENWQCNDGNENLGDGCHLGKVEYGYYCKGSPSVCTQFMFDDARGNYFGFLDEEVSRFGYRGSSSYNPGMGIYNDEAEKHYIIYSNNDLDGDGSYEGCYEKGLPQGEHSSHRTPGESICILKVLDDSKDLGGTYFYGRGPNYGDTVLKRPYNFVEVISKYFSKARLENTNLDYLAIINGIRDIKNYELEKGEYIDIPSLKPKQNAPNFGPWTLLSSSSSQLKYDVYDDILDEVDIGGYTLYAPEYKKLVSNYQSLPDYLAHYYDLLYKGQGTSSLNYKAKLIFFSDGDKTGNGKIESGEECDDGNTTNWDGCTGGHIDAGSYCVGEPSKCFVFQEKYSLWYKYKEGTSFGDYIKQRKPSLDLFEKYIASNGTQFYVIASNQDIDKDGKYEGCAEAGIYKGSLFWCMLKLIDENDSSNYDYVGDTVALDRAKISELIDKYNGDPKVESALKSSYGNNLEKKVYVFPR